MGEILSPRKIANRWSRADLRTELPSGDPGVEGQPYIEPTTGKLEVSRGQHKQINMEALQSLPADLFHGYYAVHTRKVDWQMPASNLPDGTPTDFTNEVVHPSIVTFDRKWNGYKYWLMINPYPGNVGTKENPSIAATNDDTLATWEYPEGIVNPITPFPTGFNSQGDPSMTYDAERDMLVVYYLSTYTGGRQFRSVESSDGVNWTQWASRVTHTGTETYGSPCIVTYLDGGGAQRTRLIYTRDFRLCWKDSTYIHGDQGTGNWDNLPENVSACTLPRDRMLWDFQAYRLSSGEWLLCQTLSDYSIIFTECYFGTSTDDMRTVQFDPAPKLGSQDEAGDVWVNQAVYTTALVAKDDNGILVFNALSSGRGTSGWGAQAVQFRPRPDVEVATKISAKWPLMASPKTGNTTTVNYLRDNISSVFGWEKIREVGNSADGLVFTPELNGWLRNETSGVDLLTDLTFRVKFRIDQDPAGLPAGKRIGVCNVGGIFLTAIRHPTAPAWQMEVATFAGATPTVRLLAETLPGSYGEFITVGVSKKGDLLTYESNTDNTLLANTATFAHTFSARVELGQPSTSTIEAITIQEFDIWPEGLHKTVLARTVRREGLQTKAKNLIVNSEELDNASWSKFRATVSPDVATNPYGRTTADKIIATAVHGTHGCDVAHTLRRGIPYTFSVDIKMSGVRYVMLFLNGEGRFFDLDEGVMLGAYAKSPWDSHVVAGLDGWHRCSVTVVAPILGGNALAGIYLSDSGTGILFTGNGTSGVLIGGCQLAQNEAAPITYHRRLGA